MVYQAGARLFPNGEIRLFCRPSGSPRKSQSETDESHAGSVNAPMVARAASAPPLDSSCEVQGVSKATEKRGWGRLPDKTVFGLKGKRTLLRVGGVIDRLRIDQSRQVFLTGTLPGGTVEALKAIAVWSGYIVNRVKTWVSDLQGSKLDFYVWERQKRGALHLHYFVIANTNEIANEIIKKFKDKWIQILQDVGRKAGCSLFVSAKGVNWEDCPTKIQAYAQSVRVGVAAYLAKYCSKDSSKQSSQQSQEYYPSRWWGCSRPLLKLLKELTFEVLFDGLSSRQAMRWYNRIVDIAERDMITYYSYGERRGYQRYAVCYSSYEVSKLVFEELSCLKLPILTSRNLQPTDAIAVVARIISHLELRVTSYVQSLARHSAFSWISPLLSLTWKSITVSRLVDKITFIESKLNLWLRELRKTCLRRIDSLMGLLEWAKNSLVCLILTSQTDWHIDKDSLIPLKFALTRPTNTA